MRLLAALTLLAAALVMGSTPAAAQEPPKGFQLPACTGPCKPYYTKKAERFLRCVAWRESSGRWTVDGRWGSGAFQIIGSTSKAYAKKLGLDWYADHRAATWPPGVQTAVAYAMVNPKPDKAGLEGAHHWSPQWAATIGASTYACPK